MNLALYTAATSNPRAKVPTRKEILEARCTFQGLSVNFPTYGVLPCWETLAWFPNQSDRMAFYQAKKAINDQRTMLDLTGRYNEPGQPYYDLQLGKDWTNDLVGFRTIVEEAINNGLWIEMRLGADGQSINPNPSFGEYNDDTGWTYGFQWIMNFFPTVVEYFKSLSQYIVFNPTYDGGFEAWSPENVRDFGTLFRSLLPDGYLAMEFQAGALPLGSGAVDYEPGGRLEAYDEIQAEYDYWTPGTPAGDTVWQINGRLCSPYNRPSNQPPNDDPNPPYYLLDSPRGARVARGLEWGVYEWVRGEVDSFSLNQNRTELKQMGMVVTG